MSKKQIEDFVLMMSKREDSTPKEIEQQVLEIFGVEVNLEVVQERKKAKKLTEKDISESGGMIDMFKEGEKLELKEWDDEHIYKDAMKKPTIEDIIMKPN